MDSFFNRIRREEAPIPMRKQAVHTVAVLLLGIGLGIFSKFLDNTAMLCQPYWNIWTLEIYWAALTYGCSSHCAYQFTAVPPSERR